MDCDRSKFEKCVSILEEAYGVPLAEEIGPEDLLVQTILSQNTTDVNSLRAFGKLKGAYPDYDMLLRAPDQEIADLIRVGGLADIKARRIKDALEQIRRDRGAVDLKFLKGMSLEEARRYLMALPGVGPKTTAVVLLFAFGFPIMPVDTHVYRVSQRLGLVPEKVSIEDAQRALEECTPPDKYFSLHLNLIRHGRRICRARGPLHDQCVLRGICDCWLRAKGLNDRKTTP
ncbi:MAG TPA: endonuclease III [Methanotrichaceae archaeon]|nr:endonuclease III [Methanotrichaceae archaeon]